MKKQGLILALFVLLVTGLAGCTLQPGGDTTDDSSSSTQSSSTSNQKKIPSKVADSQDSQDESDSKWTDYSNSEDKYKPLCVYDTDCLAGQVCGGGQCRDVTKNKPDPKQEQANVDKKKQEEAYDAQGPQTVGDATYDGLFVTVTFDREIVFDKILRDSLDVGNSAFYAVDVQPKGNDKKTAVFELNALPKDGVTYKFLITGGSGLGPKDAKSKTYMVGDRKWFHTYTKEELGI